MLDTHYQKSTLVAFWTFGLRLTMLIYFIIFCAVGAAIGKFSRNRKTALAIILGAAMLWGVAHMPIWGLVTLGELLLGYFLFDVFFKSAHSPPQTEDENKESQ